MPDESIACTSFRSGEVALNYDDARNRCSGPSGRFDGLRLLIVVENRERGRAFALADNHGMPSRRSTSR